MNPEITSTIVAALACSLMRGSLNAIDRLTLGIEKKSILAITLLSNIYPASAVIGIALFAGMITDLLHEVFTIRAFVFGLLVQAVAYGFSHAFRSRSVSEVVLLSKVPDALVPISVYFVLGKLVWPDAILAIASASICIFAVRSFSGSLAPDATVYTLWATLLLQATFAPTLTPSDASLMDLLLFAGATIIWRAGFSAVAILPALAIARTELISIAGDWRMLMRAAVALGVQLTFVYALSGSHPVLAWTILSSSGLFAVVLSALALRERPPLAHSAALVGIVAFASMRMLDG